jgi:hypothetical protein
MRLTVVLLVFLFALAAGPSAARASLLAYAITTSNQFGTVDLNTGVSTLIGLTGGPVLSGLGEINGSLYGGIVGSNILDSVNPATGALTVVGTGTISYGVTGSTTTGLYAIDTSEDEGLWSVNPSTGATTLIGRLGIGPAGSIGLSTNSSTLYYFDDGKLYTLNTSTGLPTLVGNNGNDISAMVFEGGSLYAGGFAGPVGLQIDTLNTATGQGTFVAPETGPVLGFDGLAPAPSSGVPEPSCLGLLGSAIAGLALLRRRQRLHR